MWSTIGMDRKAVLVGAVADRLRGVIHEICQQKGFEALRSKLRHGHLWAPSFYIGTAGQVSATTIKRYIERTEHVRTRR